MRSVKQNLVKSLIVSCSGNLLEWYDFGLFSAFSIIFSQQFFPEDDPKIALIKVFGIYASGFLFRPFGAIVSRDVKARINGEARLLV